MRSRFTESAGCTALRNSNAFRVSLRRVPRLISRSRSDLLKGAFKANPQYNQPTKDSKMIEEFPGYMFPVSALAERLFVAETLLLLRTCGRRKSCRLWKLRTWF